MDNAFLRHFLQGRQALANASEKDKKKGSSESTIPTAKEEQKKGVTYASIIEDCPPKAKVLEYIRGRIEELEEDD
jgi:hypothetical protein